MGKGAASGGRMCPTKRGQCFIREQCCRDKDVAFMFDCGVHFGVLSGNYDYKMVNTLMFMDSEIISNGINDGLDGA